MKKYSCFTKTLWQKTERSYLKEISIGVLLAIVICIGLCYYLPIVFLLILGYLSLYQMTCMFRNEIFWGKKDFEVIGITDNNIEFKNFYVLCRIICDTTITNIIVFVSICIFFIVTSNINALLLWVSLWVANALIAPSNNYLGSKVGETISIFISVIFVLFTAGIVIAYALDFRLISEVLRAESVYGGIMVIGFSLIYIIIVDYFSAHYNMRKVVSISPRKLILWLGEKDIMVYKDYLLLWEKIFMNLISVVAMVVLLSSGEDVKIIPTMILIGLMGDWFGMRKNKKYLVLTEDYLFDENKLIEDKIIIRKSKARTIFSEVVLKMTIGIILAIFYRVFSFELVLLMFVFFLAIALLQVIKIYGNNMATRMMNETIKYSMLILSSLVLFFKTNYNLVILYMIFIIIIYSFFVRKHINT